MGLIDKFLDDAFRDLEKPENKEIRDFLNDKLSDYFKGLFSGLDMKNLKGETERLEELSKQNKIKINELIEIARFRKVSAVSDIEKSKANLLDEAARNYEQLDSISKVYLINSLFGHSKDNIEEIQGEKNLKNALIEIKKEELRKLQIENNELNDKYERNKEI